MRGLADVSVVVGLGSPHGDDRAGWDIIDRLAARSEIAVAKARDGVDLLQMFAEREHVLVIDAAVPRGNPGRLNRFRWPDSDLNGVTASSTHALGLVDALRLAEAIGRAPRRLTIITIEAKEFSPCSSLSEEVDESADRLVEALISVRDFDEMRLDNSCGS